MDHDSEILGGAPGVLPRPAAGDPDGPKDTGRQAFRGALHVHQRRPPSKASARISVSGFDGPAHRDTPVHRRAVPGGRRRSGAAGADVVLVDFPVVSNYEGDRPGALSIKIPAAWSALEYLKREIVDLSAWSWDDFLRGNGDPAIPNLAAVDGSRIWVRRRGTTRPLLRLRRRHLHLPGLHPRASDRVLPRHPAHRGRPARTRGDRKSDEREVGCTGADWTR